jgi:hypothetical protein
LYLEKDCFEKSQNYSAQVAAELNIHLEAPLSTKTVRHELYKSIVHGGAAIARPLITESNAQMRKRWCYDHKTWTPNNWKCMRDCVILSDVSSFMLFPTSIRKSLHLENTQGNLQFRMPGSNSETQGRFFDGLGSNVMVQCSVVPIITLHGQITAREYMDKLGNQVHHMLQMLFLNNDAVLQHDSAFIHRAGTVQS